MKKSSLIKRIITLLFFFMSVFPLSAEESYFFNQISISEGLSQSSVKVIYRDHVGLLWVGTKEGLNRYDGFEIIQYFLNPADSVSIPHNDISSVFEDANKDLWVLTDGGMCTYNRQNNTFSRKLVNGKKIIFKNALPYKNKVYFAASNGVFVYDCKSGKWDEIYFTEKKASLTLDSKLEMLNEKTILIASRWSGLYECDLTTGNLKKSDWYDAKMVLDIYRDKENNFWISEYEKGVYCFSPEGKQKKQLLQSEISNTMAMIEFEGKIWFATDGKGLYTYFSEKDKLLPVSYYQNRLNNLRVKSYISFYEDKYSNLWIGSVRSGLFEVKKSGMMHFGASQLNSTNGLSDMSVVNIFEDLEKKIWIGTDGGGINLFNPQDNSFRHFPSTFNKKVISITDYDAGRLLLSVYNEGLILFNKNTGSVEPFTLLTNAFIQNHWLGANICNYRKEKIYISTGKLIRFSKSDNTFTILYDKNDGVLRFTKSAFSDKIILYDLSSVFELNPENDELKKVLKVSPEMGMINSVEKTKDESYWIGTNTGLYLYKKNTIDIIERTRFRTVSTLVLDRDQTLWIGAGTKLYRYFIEDKRIASYGKTDGINPTEYLPKSKLLTSDGDVYMGGVNGFVKISRDLQNHADRTPEISFLSIKLDGIDTSLKNKNVNKINVPWSFNSLAIQLFINSPHLGFSKPVRFTIDGGKTFRKVENQVVQLEHLQTGKYMLQVQYELQNNKWSEPFDLLIINVIPPWWKSWWFYLLAVTVAVVFVYYLWKKIKKQNEQKRQEEIQKLERELSEEKVRFMTNISHELRTPLTLIYSPMRRLLQSMGEDEKLRPELLRMYRQVKGMKNLVDMVLDVRKMDKVNEVLAIKTHEFNEFVLNVLEDFRIELDFKKINLQVKTDERITNVDFDKNSLRKVISNLLMNAVKFSEENTNIYVTTELNSGKVKFSVADEGEGVFAADADKLFTRFFQAKHEKGGSGIGLSYSKMQVELHNGTIGYKPNLPKGALFWFEIPEKHPNASALQENAAGTEMEMSEIQLNVPENETKSLLNLKERTVLVVDDEIDMLDYLKKSLLPYYKEVQAASNGVNALDVMRKMLPDLVISDVMMPVMNGYELCKTIKNDIHISHIPVVLLTALSDDENKLMGYKQGADFYLTKPFAVDILLNMTANFFNARESLKKNYSEGFSVNTEKITFSNADERFMKKLMEFIDKNLNNTELNMDIIAGEMAMSRSGFYSKVKTITGMSANNFLINYKMKLAAACLLNSDESIQDISFKFGFDNQRYFSTVFRQHFNTTPSEYRKQKNL